MGSYVASLGTPGVPHCGSDITKGKDFSIQDAGQVSCG